MSWASGQIRRVSIDQFYALATGQADSFYQLCRYLPRIVDDVLTITNLDTIIQNTVLNELADIASDDLLKNIFTTSFASYHGFNNFAWG
ncbi:Eco47II family restriction endonuclease [Moraxella atlantae]|uniref:Eco47II family restriction endonuclease n=1 Tax=Faucicola atlantae TaxID=34059 RepID=UPI000ABF6307|nr:Eco47II family restriction endonuclease [Moraxella atlantae]